jgi:hypothetical protein
LHNPHLTSMVAPACMKPQTGEIVEVEVDGKLQKFVLVGQEMVALAAEDKGVEFVQGRSHC